MRVATLGDINPVETMMASSDRGVPRADHVPAEEQEESIRAQEAESPTEPASDSAAKRGHGAHGKGDGREEHIDPQVAKPDFTKGTDRGGSAAWGGEAAGGSTFDKRGKKKT
jgi:hypothetical protein